MTGVRVTLPDGKVLQVDDEGAPVDFVEPADLTPPADVPAT
jgi:hypothetical protein